MKTFTKTFNTVRGSETVTADVFRMDGCEAVDVYQQDESRFANGGFRIEFMVNGLPRGTLFHSGDLGLDISDADDVTRACIIQHHATI